MRADLEEVVALERALLDPAIRADPERVARLLHPDFSEVGASGRRWTRDGLIAALRDQPGVGVEMTEVEARPLADAVVLLTYTADAPTGRSRRSSLWIRDGLGWRILFHQGTPA